MSNLMVSVRGFRTLAHQSEGGLLTVGCQGPVAAVHGVGRHSSLCGTGCLRAGKFVHHVTHPKELYVTPTVCGAYNLSTNSAAKSVNRDDVVSETLHCHGHHSESRCLSDSSCLPRPGNTISSCASHSPVSCSRASQRHAQVSGCARCRCVPWHWCAALLLSPPELSFSISGF